MLATVHVKADEPRGPRLAHDAIINLTELSSVRPHWRLEPLVVALEAQPRADARELANAQFGLNHQRESMINRRHHGVARSEGGAIMGWILGLLVLFVVLAVVGNRGARLASTGGR